jgi:hypothetical protein
MDFIAVNMQKSFVLGESIFKTHLSDEMKNQTRLNREGKIKSQQRIETINFRREIQTAILGRTCGYNLFGFGCAFVFPDNSAC